MDQLVSLAQDGPGLSATLGTRGAALHALHVPTPHGAVNVVLGYENLDDYVSDPFFMGATVGRVAGRIGRGRCVIDGQAVQLNTQGNPEGHCLHGGAAGFHTRQWRSEAQSDACVLTYRSADGEQGFPGNVDASVTYQLEAMRLTVTLRAVSDATTPVSLSSHPYFNLSGAKNVDEHEVTVNADGYVPLGPDLIPLGHVEPLGQSPLDLRSSVRLAEKFSTGVDAFDHYYVLSKRATASPAASAYAPDSGIRLSVSTTAPGLQFYTGHYLAKPFVRRQGLCFEPGGFPDAVNHRAFPAVLLKPGDVFQQVTTYEFDAGG